MSDSAEQILRDGLALVARDCPAANAQMLEAFGSTRLDIDVGGERFRLAFTPGDASLGADVEVRTTGQTLVDLLEGNLGAHDAILSDRLFVRGDAAALIAASEAALWFLKGALRTRDAETLVTRLGKLP